MIEFYFILTEPQMGENIGAAARVMANFGFSNLRIINPRDGWPNLKAELMATCGQFILEQAQIFSDLPSAIDDLHFNFALCGKNIQLNKPIYTPSSAKLKIEQELVNNNITKIGLVFGCERIGLTYEQIAYCNAILNIPTSENCSSMNLAQALAVMAYEFNNINNENIDNLVSPATTSEVNFMLDKLEQFLTDANFFQELNKKPKMMINIKNMFNRNTYSSQEIRTLHGIFRNLFEYTSSTDIIKN